MRLLLILAAFVVLAGLPAMAQDKKKPEKKQADPAFAAVTDDPKLPRVLLIGDSISIGYTVPTRKLLERKANVHRIPENGGPTTNGRAKIKKWLGDAKWDVIHFNWGLHDIKMDTGKHQVPVGEYENNLRELVHAMKATKAKLIWANTTPVPPGDVKPVRRDDDVVSYNAVAKKIMDDNNIAVNDLYAFAAPRLKTIQLPVNVHFTASGSAALAERVAREIEAALKD